jgi:predicted double-glycine peptidase
MSSFPTPPLATSRPRLRAGYLAGCLAWMASTVAMAAPPMSRAVLSPQAGAYYSAPVISYRDLPFRTVVRQQYDFSCGSAAVATLLRYSYGRDVDEGSIFRAMYVIGNKGAIQKHGFSLADIKLYLQSQGLQSDGYRLPLERFAQARIPAIVVVRIGQYKHFVVIKGIENGYVLVGDPALGLRSYTLADFQKIWDGLVFVIHDEAHPDNHHNFDNPAEWALLVHPPVGPAAHQDALYGPLAVMQQYTIFQVRGPNVASTNP